MRIPSGVTDQYIYFVAVDSTDLKTRETGLTTFTVYRSRNGAAAAAMTTPTVNETDTTNMPGVYELLLDEDMTITAGNDSEEMVFHITQASMAPVTRTIELYRSKITAGNTLGVESDGDLTQVNALAGHTAQTGDSYARLGAPAGASIAADLVVIDDFVDDIGVAGAGLTAVPWNSAWDTEVESEVADALVAIHLDHLVAVDYDPASPPGTATALLNEIIESNGGVSRFTAGALAQGPDSDTDHTGTGTGLTAIPWAAAWDTEVESEVTDALNAYDPPTKTEMDSGFSALNDPTAAENADAVWDEAATGHTDAGKAGEQLWTDVDAILADTAELQTDDVPGLIAAQNDVSTAQVNAEVDTALADANLDHLVGTATAIPAIVAGTYIDQMMDDGTAVYDRTTDSLQAIRDRGDAGWITGGGGGITDILNVQPMVPVNIDLADTATVRLGLMLTNALDDLPTTAEITPGTLSIHRKAIGGTSWSAIVTDGACSESAGQVYYDEVFDSGTGYAEGDSIRLTFKSQKITVAANDYEITDATGIMFQTSIRQTERGTDSAYTGTPPTAVAIRTEIDSNSTELATIKADTNELQVDDVPTLIAALPTAIENRTEMDSNSTQLAAIVADTNELQVDDIPTLIAALPTAAENADAVHDEALAGHVVAGSAGKALADIETDATAILADTGELQTDDVPTLIAALPTAIENRTEMDSNSTQLAAIVADTNELQVDDVPGLIAALNDLSTADVNTQVDAAFTTQMADSVPADGAIPTREQAFYMAIQFLTERAVSGTTVTVKKVDGSTSLMTFTLDDGTTPTSITRAS